MNTSYFRKVSLLGLALFLCVSAIFAKVQMPALFNDNMVLQQQTEVPVWGKAEKSKQVIVKTSWNDKSYSCKADKKGKWVAKIQTPTAGGPYEISISDGEELVIKNILIGEVWLCSGQSNMEMPMKGYSGQPVRGSNLDILKSKNNTIRFISVPRAVKTIPQDDFKGEWEVAEPKTVAKFSATAYYFARLLQETLDVPVGLIEVSYGGSCVEAWMSKESSQPFKDAGIPEVSDSAGIDNRTPTTLFNGMLSPVIGYGIKGAVWYQGETNFINASEYAHLFSTMVKEWRELWGQGDFPFYFTQIAPYDYSVYYTIDDYKEIYNSAYLREAQLKAVDLIPNSGMAVLMDIGEKSCIHPADKKTGGERLAFFALAKNYGIEGFGYATPVMKELEIVGSTITISFDNLLNGLTSYNKEITQFEIAGKNKKFYPAQAQLRRKSVIVSAPQVKEPVAVRYAFKDFIKGELFSVEGIPVSSFRSDDW